jgi:hypothetical protein
MRRFSSSTLTLLSVVLLSAAAVHAGSDSVGKP